MDLLFQSPSTPIAVGFVVLFVAGFLELKTNRVPNALTLSAIALAFVFSIAASWIAPERSGGFVSVLVGMLAGGVVMIPFYSAGWLGAGCVKAQAAFGAWVGCGVAVLPCLKIVILASIVAAIVTAVYCFVVAKRSEADGQEMGLINGQLPLSLGTLVGIALNTFV